MKVFDWKNLPHIGGVIALGSFDGVHIGHQKLLKFAKERGILTALTFTPHPRLFFGIERENFLLTLDEEKREFLLSAGVQEVLFVKFDEEFSSLSPEEFVKNVLIKRLNPEVVVVGFDYHFGKKSSGHAKDLERICGECGIKVHIFPEVLRDDRPVKSTLIRQFIREGNMESASEYLGRPYSLRGRVIKGDGIGSKIGFPTCNLKVNPLKILPPSGVYTVSAYYRGGIYPGMLYIGNKPTLGRGKKSIEVHIIGFEGETYGEELMIRIYHRLRDQVKFDSVEELKKTLVHDRENTLKKLKEAKYGA